MENLLDDTKSQSEHIQSESDRLQNSLKNKLTAKSQELSELDSKYRQLEAKYTELQEKFRRTQALHPAIEQEIADMIQEEKRQRDMAAAKEVDSAIQDVISFPASKDIFLKVSNARNWYYALSPEQKSYITSDIDKLDKLYTDSQALKEEFDRKEEERRAKSEATSAESSICSLLPSRGTAENFSRLVQALTIYNGLSSGARKYFDDSITRSLYSLHSQAKRDKDQKEEEERRRREAEERKRREEERRRREEERRRREKEEEERRRHTNSIYGSSSHSSSFGSSSHFGGFGGHSGGGGASRGF